MLELLHKNFKAAVRNIFKDLKERISIIIERWEILANKWKIYKDFNVNSRTEKYI